jgi:hypothetical protein
VFQLVFFTSSQHRQVTVHILVDVLFPPCYYNSRPGWMVRPCDTSSWSKRPLYRENSDSSQNIAGVLSYPVGRTNTLNRYIYHYRDKLFSAIESTGTLCRVLNTTGTYGAIQKSSLDHSTFSSVTYTWSSCVLCVEYTEQIWNYLNHAIKKYLSALSFCMKNCPKSLSESGGATITY